MKASEKDFRNYMVNDPYLNARGRKGFMPKPRSLNCCGLAATGDAEPATPIAEPAAKVSNTKAMGLLKTGLALVGLFVIGKYIYSKVKK